MSKNKLDKNIKGITLIVIGSLFIFITYLVIFNLIRVDATSSTIVIDLSRFAVKVKNTIVDNSVFYGFLVLILATILIPAYMRHKV
jgi:membrane-bound ClpP family serine protease